MESIGGIPWVSDWVFNWVPLVLKRVPRFHAMVLVGGIPWVPSGISQKMLKQIFKPQKILIFNININILRILILILILILGFEKFWYWFWYWGWENFDIDIDFDIEEIVWRILILILILKTKFLKILILILNKNLILCHVWLSGQLGTTWLMAGFHHCRHPLSAGIPAVVQAPSYPTTKPWPANQLSGWWGPGT